MAIPSLSESIIRQQATAESFRRGEDYYWRGAVGSLVQRGNALQAEVEGSQYEPYRVRVTFDEGGITDADCSCPYDWGGWCKHIVATLLACLEAPDEIEGRPALDELLTDLDREELQDLLLHLATQNPYVVDEIESQVALLRSTTAESQATEAATVPPRRTPVDPQPVRRQVTAILHSLDYMRPSEAYWQVNSVVGQVRQLLNQVQGFLEAGDGRNALVLLEAITDEYVEGWICLDDSDGYAGEFFGELGEAWTEACLVADLSPSEREMWAHKLTRWQGEISDYGLDDVFDAAQTAVLQGWDYPPLQRVLRGEITELGAWEDEAPWFADDLAVARLKVLERQGRYQEYLYLAEAEGQMEQYVLILARLGRVQQAVDEGLRALYEPGQFLSLAKVLREQGELAAALHVAEHGLTLEGSKGPLAAWLCDLAAGMGEPERAFKAATVAFQADPSMAAYQRVQELAGERWTKIREELLAHLRQASFFHCQAQVDIFLHEGLLDDAITAVEKGGSYELIERVMDAVIEHRPDWVIQVARRQAERIIEAGQSQYYHHAVNWLDRARTAYRAADREAEWQAYLGEIRACHGRKYKLMGMLEGFK
ncbi:MAG: SWIM zinc finger domain-containing protein [Chloroflexi bacterium]|nr:SWIM zinc finger domain-containing protein [Chloroflexota bacterium]